MGNDYTVYKTMRDLDEGMRLLLEEHRKHILQARQSEKEAIYVEGLIQRMEWEKKRRTEARGAEDANASKQSF